jgi:hypothetical protein
MVRHVSCVFFYPYYFRRKICCTDGWMESEQASSFIWWLTASHWIVEVPRSLGDLNTIKNSHYRTQLLCRVLSTNYFPSAIHCHKLLRCVSVSSRTLAGRVGTCLLHACWRLLLLSNGKSLYGVVLAHADWHTPARACVPASCRPDVLSRYARLVTCGAPAAAVAGFLFCQVYI